MLSGNRSAELSKNGSKSTPSSPAFAVFLVLPIRTNDGRFASASPKCCATCEPIAGYLTLAVGKYPVCVTYDARGWLPSGPFIERIIHNSSAMEAVSLSPVARFTPGIEV